jgi:REP element-mobilizing transposase RayT
MSKPRPVIPGTSYFITRTCSQRQFLLRPSIEVQHAVEYCLGYAASRNGVLIHAICVLSNHIHMVVTDVRGELPAFMEWFHGYVARSLNAHYGRSENFFSPGSYGRVEPISREDVLDKMVYTLANPVAAGLVSRGEHWPGVRSKTLTEGAYSKKCPRPRFFFRPNSKLPESVTLTIERPPGFEDMTEREFGELYSHAVETRECQTRALMRQAERRFLGIEAVMAQDPLDSPRTPREPSGVRPRVASKDKKARAEKLRAMGQWLQAYRDAARDFAAGIRDALFPSGTYWMRIHCGVRCAPG